MHLTFSDGHGLLPVHIQVEEVCWGCPRPTKLQPRLLEGYWWQRDKSHPFRVGGSFTRLTPSPANKY